MSVIKNNIKAEIDQMMTSLLQEQPEDIPTAFADKLADIVRNAILSATVTVPTGIPVATTGIAAAQTGATTAPAIATIQ